MVATIGSMNSPIQNKKGQKISSLFQTSRELVSKIEQLESAMSALSEMIWCAGWMAGFEYECWEIITGIKPLPTSEGTMRDGSPISDGEECVNDIKRLAKELDGWIVESEYFVTTEEWKEMFAPTLKDSPAKLDGTQVDRVLPYPTESEKGKTDIVGSELTYYIALGDESVRIIDTSKNIVVKEFAVRKSNDLVMILIARWEITPDQKKLQLKLAIERATGNTLKAVRISLYKLTGEPALDYEEAAFSIVNMETLKL